MEPIKFKVGDIVEWAHLRYDEPPTHRGFGSIGIIVGVFDDEYIYINWIVPMLPELRNGTGWYPERFKLICRTEGPI